MSMETRNGVGTYYTRSQRVYRRIIRTYVGSGLVASDAADEDGEIRLEKAAERARVRESDAEFRLLDEILARYAREVDHAIEVELAGMQIMRRRSELRIVRCVWTGMRLKKRIWKTAGLCRSWQRTWRGRTVVSCSDMLETLVGKSSCQSLVERFLAK